MSDLKDNKEVGGYIENHLLDKVFVKDTDFQYIFKKTEKIVTAIYLISNFFSTDEPLKWSLRKESGNLLKSVVTFSRGSMSLMEKNIHNINSCILELSSLFNLAYNSGFISNMNYDIVNYEISKLAANVLEYSIKGTRSNTSLFDEKYFHVHKDVSGDVKDSFKGQYKRQDNVLNKTKVNRPVIKKKTSNSNRRDSILSVIKEKGEVSVKDIAIVVSDVSEKTLQRELLAMVDEGIIIKKGERRWSRYLLK